MLRVLIAEDNIILADILEASLQDGGCDVCGVAYSVDDAVAQADRTKPTVAVLDYRLAHGGLGSEIKPRLQDPDAVGILYVSADDLSQQLSAEDGEACLQKPYSIDDLLKAVRIVHGMKSDDAPCPQSFPKNFYLLRAVDVTARRSA